VSREYVLQPFHAPVELQIDYARELNEQQHAAVTALPGPALVIAGAGSGKTRTLTYRVAYLLEQGIPPERILLLTFTNKAAREMMRRVADLLGRDLPELWGGTFHSIGVRVLRRHAELLGYRPDFTILDREDSSDLLKTCIAEAEIDVKATRFPKADVVNNIISMALNTHRSVSEVVAQDYDYFAALAPQIADVAARYVKRKQAANVMDFDDLLALWLKLLQDHEAVREQFQRRFQFILVDEYQDTNKLQSDLIDLLGAKHKNVMVVGDDSQSIYAWRGANFRNILEFPKRYPGTKTYKVEINYRSTPEILSVANAAIAANTEQFSKQLTAAKKSGQKPVLVVCGDGNQQAGFIAQRVLELREEGRSLNEMAVLYRSHFHALELQLEFTRRNIPFSITSGIRFFEQAHIKDVAAYLKLVTNPTDELSFKRLAMMLPGIGGKGAEKLWGKFSSELKPPPAGASSEANQIATALQKSSGAAPKKTEKAWAQFAITLSQLEVEPVRSQPWEMIRTVIEAGYEDYLQETFANYRNRLEDLEQLASFARTFQSTEEFLTQLSLLTNIEAEDQGTKSKDDEQVRLSTIHQAKGLEFDVVFVIMLCDGLFPSSRSSESVEGEEEERRLFYVAITRARDELYLTYPLIRATQAYGGDAIQIPSRFLKEIPTELIEEWSLRTYG
jgi:DNA helicase-2/ATP-dependent DNA helicase PcrA